MIAATPNCRMSVANALEASIVLEGRGGTEAGLELNAFLESAGIELAPVTLAQLAAARRARRRFGKGNHPAALNFGDCFAYALARIRHQLPAADADALALRGRAPSSRFDVLSSTPASSSGPRDQAGRRLDALTTKVGDGCGLATTIGEPLLYKGDDFSRTDIPTALASDGEPGQ